MAIFKNNTTHFAATTALASFHSREFSVAFRHLPLVSGVHNLKTDKFEALVRANMN